MKTISVARTSFGNSYWLASSDGGVFAFGNARLFGSMGGQPLDTPVVGIAHTLSRQSYWLTADAGRVLEVPV